jgi:hypothetical protein
VLQLVKELKQKSPKNKVKTHHNLIEPPIPGFESYFDENRTGELHIIEANLTKLLFSLNFRPEILVYDKLFFPHEVNLLIK